MVFHASLTGCPFVNSSHVVPLARQGRSDQISPQDEILRVTGGFLKGREIRIRKSGPARYTSSKVRQALFNALGDVGGSMVLDLFAGSGSFAIEALSRGASRATCVESDKDRAVLIRENFRSLDLEKTGEVMMMDVRHALRFLYNKGVAYDIIFMDPPYEKGFFPEIISLLETYRVYSDDATLIVEHSKREIPEISSSGYWVEAGQRTYGDTGIRVLKARKVIESI